MVVILGPTASGKTRLAVRLAKDQGGEIISADSRQVYRGMDLGTGKDLLDYTLEGVAIPFHLVDIVEPLEEFHLFAYQRLFHRCFKDVTARGALPVLVGGSGMYLEAVIRSYDLQEVPENKDLRRELDNLDMDALASRLRAIQPDLHNKTDLLDRERLLRAIEIAEVTRVKRAQPADGMPDINPLASGLWPHASDTGPPVSGIWPLVIGVRWERAVLRRRITDRLHARLQSGMVEEVAALHQRGVSWERLYHFGLEYRYISQYLQGLTSFDDMAKTLNTRIHQFAKRQDTWFRRMERLGVVIHWIPGDDYAALRSLMDRFPG
ncbi:MAG: tRNA (adenosine(37)-N6)-dimethylallyltransferase MiaA [Deltaproteobacteria bacterium]|nr:tRNA (adenosine(37)-N6)-dimethylallyltransferase MiaA [Deltaproteobacteria bacterium]